MNVLIGFRDNHTFMAIMALPDKGLSLFDFEKLLKPQNTASWNTPCLTTKCTLAADPFEWYPHGYYPGRSKAGGMVESLPAISAFVQKRRHFCCVKQRSASWRIWGCCSGFPLLSARVLREKWPTQHDSSQRVKLNAWDWSIRYIQIIVQ